MIEKDNIQELFSKAFENHASPVRPDLWTGVQAKMAAAGMTTGGAVAAKGISALAKWLIGTAAVTTVGVVTYVATSSDEPAKPTTTIAGNTEKPAGNQNDEAIANTTAESKKELADNTAVAENKEVSPKIQFVTPPVSDLTDTHIPFIDIPPISDPFKMGDAGAGNKSDQQFGQKTDKQNTPSGTQQPDNGNSGSSSKQENPATNNEVVEAKKVPAAKIELPNIFTPNGDRANDLCEFVTLENVKQVDITILDQDGKTVYRSNDLNFAWDGTTMNGEQARIGIYTCLISYIDLGDVAKNKTAYIYLQR